jgi:hypothetical protein
METHDLEARKLTPFDLISSSARVATIIGISLALIGGTFDWIYLNNQEFTVNFFDAQASYVEGYISGFIIAIVEIGAALYFLQRYDLGGRTKSYFLVPAVLGVLASLVYVLAEVASSVTLLNGVNVSVPQLISLELAPASMDYGNAVIIGLSIFSFAILLRVLFKLNPMPKRVGGSSGPHSSVSTKAPTLLGGVWAGFITTASATLCCGPLPGAIALASGISSVYFGALINWQPILVLVGLPLLIFAIITADKRARSYCKFR